DPRERARGAEPRKHLPEATDVRIVERGINLVEDRERAGVDLVESQHQRERRERSLTGRQQGHVLEALARRLDQNLDAGARALVALRVAKGRASPRGQL